MRSSVESQKGIMFKDVLLRTRRALSLYKVYGDSALLVLNGTSLNSANALLAFSWHHKFSESYKLIPGGPKIMEQSIFQDFALSNSYLFSPCWIEHLFLVIITPRSLNLVENFLFYEYFLMDCHFRALSLSLHWCEAPQTTEHSIF